MKYLKIFTIIAFLLVNIFVIFANPKLHSPFVMEDKNFKLKRLYQTPKNTDTIKILSFNKSEQNKDIELDKANNEEPTSTREVHIERSEFYRYANGLDRDNPRNYTTRNIQQNYSQSERQLTAHEEEVAWNSWHSNLQNKIMKDNSVDAPFGTLIKFSFNVSNKGKISNIKVGCTNKFYKEKVVNALTKLIQSYEKTSILDFPENSDRKEVDFKGAYLIWFETQFSSPDNYNDIERVKRYE